MQLLLPQARAPPVPGRSKRPRHSLPSAFGAPQAISIVKWGAMGFVALCALTLVAELYLTCCHYSFLKVPSLGRQSSPSQPGYQAAIGSWLLSTFQRCG